MDGVDGVLFFFEGDFSVVLILDSSLKRWKFDVFYYL